MLKSHKKILGLGEIMLRLTSWPQHPLSETKQFDVHFGGAESTVICNLAIMGHATKYVTKIPDNPLGKGVLLELRKYGVDTSDILIGGERLGTYFLELGKSLRSASVFYDRKYSSFYDSKITEYDFDKILKDVGLFHISGITPALNEETKNLTIKMIKACKERDILVSYDSNFRMKLWSVEQAAEVLKEVLPYVDFAFLGNLDMANMLHYEATGETFEEQLHDMYKQLNKAYPNIKYMACTQRDIITAEENRIRGFVYTQGEFYETNQYTFNIVDRIGTGDAFASGVLHGILKELEPMDIAKFGIASCVLKHSYYGDVNTISGEQDVIDFIKNGTTKIKR
jgi:2-dehydro-3-deoxygluconokinase